MTDLSGNMWASCHHRKKQVPSDRGKGLILTTGLPSYSPTWVRVTSCNSWISDFGVGNVSFQGLRIGLIRSIGSDRVVSGQSKLQKQQKYVTSNSKKWKMALSLFASAISVPSLTATKIQKGRWIQKRQVVLNEETTSHNKSRKSSRCTQLLDLSNTWNNRNEDVENLEDKIGEVTHHVDELDHGEPELDGDLLGEVAHGADQRVVALVLEQILHEPHFVLTAQTCRTQRKNEMWDTTN